MTCYETLRAPAPAADARAPMAHHFVKWWRTKFRNGYKKFSIGTDSERTDTEELVSRATSQCSAPPDLLPCEARAVLQPSTPTSRPRPYEPTAQSPPPKAPSPVPSSHNDEKQPRLRFEELTCDVELQHPEPSKQQPLQFSFTLYDLDGHGRMTKDDIAGIVSTIYESIGKSVTVPHYGSKTIKVRLTVIPENESTRNQRAKRDRLRRRKEPVVTTSVAADCPDHSEDEQRGRLSPDDDICSKSSCSGDHKQHRSPLPTNSQPHRQPRKEKRPHKRTKKRSGSLQRRELLEIIQANMEKNHLSFQASRKPCNPGGNEEDVINKYQKLRNRSYTVNERPSNTFQKTKTDSGNGYLDLASGGDSNLCRYDRYLHAVICSAGHKHTHTGYHRKPAHAQTQRTRASHPPHAHHPRPRSRDPPSQQPRVLQIIFL